MSKKLLLADDSFVIQKLVGLSFANEAIEIVSTDNGDDAVSMAREIRPDVVLADIVMPGLSGYEVCEAIKQDPELAGTPVLLLAGTFEPFDDARASTVGANGQITKPFEARALIERVNEVMTEAAAAPATLAKSPAPPETPPTIEIEAEATPLASETNETLVTPLGSTPESADLFGDDDGRLADETRLDLTPQLDPDEADLFGAPGEGAAEELDLAGGSLAHGASVKADASADADENEETPIAVGPGEGLPPMAPRRTAPSATSASTSDPFERPAVEEMPAEPMPKARPVDLDAALDAEARAVAEEPPALKDFGTPPPRDPFGLAATSEPDATVVEDLDAADPLGLAPTSVTGGSVDFAFDASEQGAAAPPPPDRNEDAFSSLMDISESATLGAGDERPPTPASETDDPAETIVAGFDVSSSDLATAPTAEDEDTPASEPLPEPEPLLEVPQLPEAYRPATKESPAHRSIMGDADLFDDLATGSPLDELPPVTAEATDLAFGFGEPLDVDDDLLETGLSSTLDDDLLETELPSTLDDDLRETDPSSPLDDDLEDEFAIAHPPAPEPDARVPDLSPMVEQRIQETLEKVAWEAFSDLSETIVKQVIGRVEQIAWEVIPEMAETLVREEIRKMKGEQD